MGDREYNEQDERSFRSYERNQQSSVESSSDEMSFSDDYHYDADDEEEEGIEKELSVKADVPDTCWIRVKFWCWYLMFCLLVLIAVAIIGIQFIWDGGIIGAWEEIVEGASSSESPSFVPSLIPSLTPTEGPTSFPSYIASPSFMPSTPPSMSPSISRSPVISSLLGNDFWREILTTRSRDSDETHYSIESDYAVAFSPNAICMAIGESKITSDTNLDKVYIMYLVDGKVEGLAGDVISGNFGEDFGKHLEISSSCDTVLVGDPESKSGAIVKMFRLADNQWLQKDVADDLQGGTKRRYITHLSADGNDLVVANDDVIQMFEYSNEGNYTQRGGDLSSLVGEGKIVQSLSLAGDGKHVAFTSPEVLYSDDGAEFGSSGYRFDRVQVYSYNGTAWMAKGRHLVAGRSVITGNMDHSAVDVTLSHNGDFVVIGNSRHDESSEKRNAGMVRAYTYIDDWEELGEQLVGEDPQSMVGIRSSISKSGTTLAIGRRKSNTDIEMVEIYKLTSNKKWLKKKSDDFSGSIAYIAITDDGKFVAVEEDAPAENQVHIFLAERIQDCSVSATLSFRVGESETGYRNDDLSVWRESNNETCSIHDQDRGWCFHDGNNGHIEKNGDEFISEIEKIQFIANVRTKYQVRIAHNSTKPGQFNETDDKNDSGIFGNLAISATGKQDLCNLDYNGIGEGIDWISTMTGPQDLTCTNFERIGSGVDNDYNYILGITLSCDYECNCKIIE